MITSSDFHKYGSAPMTKWIDINSKLAAKGGEWKKVLKKGDTLTGPYQESKQVEAMGAAQEFNEGTDMVKLSLEEGYAKRKGHVSVGAYIEFTNHALKLGGKKYIDRQKTGLANCPRQWLDTLAMLYLEYADTALASVPQINGKACVDTIGGDDLVLAHGTHTFSSDGANTYSNKTSSFQSLTQENLQTAFTVVNLWKNNVGNSLEANVEELILNPTNQFKGWELCHSRTKSETANRADNALNEVLPAKPTVLRKMINQTEWILRTNVENDYEVCFAWEPKQENEFIPSKGGRYVHYLDFCLAHGVNDPRHFYFNKA